MVLDEKTVEELLKYFLWRKNECPEEFMDIDDDPHYRA